MISPGQGRIQRRRAAILAPGMGRREFMALIGGAAVACPLAARAQQPAMPVIGFLSSHSAIDSAAQVAAFRAALGEAGYVESGKMLLARCTDEEIRPTGVPLA